MLLKKRYLQSRISGINDEISSVNREIRHLEKVLRKEQRFSGSVTRDEVDKKTDKVARESDDTRRLASYLSTGSFHKISRDKFRSDLVRRQRLMIAGGIIILIAAGLILWHYLG